MDDDFANMSLNSGFRTHTWSSNWDDDSARMFGNFYNDSQMQHPQPPPQQQPNMFEVSFDVRQYNPGDINLRLLEDTLVVECKHEDQLGTSEFSRKIAIPKEVDRERISSIISNDGMMTIKAPMSAQQYQSTGPNPNQPSGSSSAGPSGPGGSSPGPAAGPASSQAQAGMSSGSPPKGQPSPPTYAQQNHQLPQPSTIPGPLDTPQYTDTPAGRRMDLTLFIGAPYRSPDINLRVNGRTLLIDCNHVETVGNRTSKTSMRREFELAKDIKPHTLQSNMTNDGHLMIAAMVPESSSPFQTTNVTRTYTTRRF